MRVTDSHNWKIKGWVSDLKTTGSSTKIMIRVPVLVLFSYCPHSLLLKTSFLQMPRKAVSSKYIVSSLKKENILLINSKRKSLTDSVGHAPLYEPTAVVRSPCDP